MSRYQRRPDADWHEREQLRRSHEARERRARWAVKRAAEELVWLRHHVRFRCAGCGVGSSRPYIENEGSAVTPEEVNWNRPDDLIPCQVCGWWLCWRCGWYVPGVGWACRGSCGVPSGP